MSLGTTAMSALSTDPFALHNALKHHKRAVIKMAQEVREKVIAMNKERSARRSQQRQTFNATSHRLHQIRTEIGISMANAPPSSASQFDIDLRDHRTPRPQHHGCKVTQVSDWLRKQNSPRRLSSKDIDVDGCRVPAPPSGAYQRGASDPEPANQQQLSSTRRGVQTATSGGMGGTLVPIHDGGHHHLALPAIDRMSSRVVCNAEVDFAQLSYGHTHIASNVLYELEEDFVLDLGGRRVPVVTFVKFIERTGIAFVSFPMYLHIVYGHPMADCVAAAQTWSTRFGWAADLSEPTARLVMSLWQQWTLNGTTRFTQDQFLVLNGSPRNERQHKDLLQVFAIADRDGDGCLDRCEFARFFSGGESVGCSLASDAPTPPSSRDGGTHLRAAGKSGAH